MEDRRNKFKSEDSFMGDWSKKESEELILWYLEDYYKTLDDFYLQEALQLAKDEDVDIQKIMKIAKSRMN
ncbi:MAG: hypothetical protein Kow0042_12000 [Calditrichia bacterium]